MYLWWAFRNVPSPIRYGCAAIVALIHDVLIVIGVFALLGYLWEIEVNSMFLIAVLTIIGYSVNDTIVVFDRLREYDAQEILVVGGGIVPPDDREALRNMGMAEFWGPGTHTGDIVSFLREAVK